MTDKKGKLFNWLIPVVLFVFLLGLRMFFSFKTELLTLNSYKFLVNASYLFNSFNLPHISFYLLLSFLLLFTKKIIIIKFFSNILFILPSIMIYLISLRISKSKFFSFFSATLAGLLPLFFADTFDLLSPLSLALFLMFFCIFAFLNSEKNSWRILFIVGFIILSFTHWIVIFFILALLIYYILLRFEGIKQTASETELSLFSIFFGLWSQILIYKDFLFTHKLNIFTFNVPSELISNYFINYSLSNIMTFLGIIPVFVGLYVIYRYSFEKKGKAISFISSFVVSAVIFFFLKLSFTKIVLFVLGPLFCILLARGFYDFVFYIKQTKGVKFLSVGFILLFFVIIFLVIPPAIYFSFSNISSRSSEDLVTAALWLKDNIPEDSVVLTLPNEGSLVSYFSDKKTVITDDFLKFNDVNDRFSDVFRIYTTNFETEAIGLMEKYDSSYIVISPESKKIFEFLTPAYIKTGKCFKKIYDGSTDVYMKSESCKLRVI